MSGELDGLLVPDLLLPSQFFQPGSEYQSPEIRLVMAVMVDAIECWLKAALIEGRATPRRQACRNRGLEAHLWLFGDAGHAPYSFVWCCDLLGIEAGLLRAGLRQAAARQGAGRPALWAKLPAGLGSYHRPLRSSQPRRRRRKG